MSGVWAQLIGQESAVASLREASVQENPYHAWLVTGPPGSGRSNAALAFAAAVNCERAPETPGCGECSSCTLTLAKSHPDVDHIATRKSVISIAEAREIVLRAYDRPTLGRRRVIVIEDADRMTERTTNVLLKAIEEPPEHTVWVLCAPSPGDVLVTIRSRCRLVSLRLPSVEDVTRLLVERDGFSPEIAEAAARAAQSHVGIARRLAADPQARERRRHLVLLPQRLKSVSDAMSVASDLIDLADQEAAASLAALDAKETEQLRRQLGVEEGEAVPPALRIQLKHLQEEQARRAKRSRSDYYDRALTDVLSWYRDVLMIQTGAVQVGEGTGPDGAVLLVNADLAEQVLAESRHTTAEKTLQAMELIGTAREHLTGTNAAAQLAMESLMVQLAGLRKRTR